MINTVILLAALSTGQCEDGVCAVRDRPIVGHVVLVRRLVEQQPARRLVKARFTRGFLHHRRPLCRVLGFSFRGRCRG